MTRLALLIPWLACSGCSIMHDRPSSLVTVTMSSALDSMKPEVRLFHGAKLLARPTVPRSSADVPSVVVSYGSHVCVDVTTPRERSGIRFTAATPNTYVYADHTGERLRLRASANGHGVGEPVAKCE